MKSNIARAIERRVGGWRSGTAGYAGSASTTAVRRIVASSIITFIVVITNVTLFAGVADAAPSVQSTTDIQAAPAAAAAAPSAVVTTGFQESVAFSGLTNPSSIHFADEWQGLHYRKKRSDSGLQQYDRDQIYGVCRSTPRSR